MYMKYQNMTKKKKRRSGNHEKHEKNYLKIVLHKNSIRFIIQSNRIQMHIGQTFIYDLPFSFKSTLSGNVHTACGGNSFWITSLLPSFVVPPFSGINRMSDKAVAGLPYNHKSHIPYKHIGA